MAEQKYISALTDFGFKKLFGEPANTNLLMHFLNNLLLIPYKIVRLEFKSPEQLGDATFDRKALFDLFCEDEQGTQFIVEMQNAKQQYFRDRTIFYSTFPIRNQAPKSEWNFKLKAVYCIGFLGFCLSGQQTQGEVIQDDYLHTVQLKDEKNQVFYEKLTYVFIELPHFQKREEEIRTPIEKWIYFLKHLPEFDQIPEIFNESIFKQAFEVAEIAQLSPSQRAAYEFSLKKSRDEFNIIQTALIEGEEKGRKEGRKEGEEKGRKEGEEKGRKEALKKTAKSMLKKGIALNLIAEFTGLSQEEIESLK